MKDLPGCSIKYARRGRYIMYLVTRVHEECPYILAHYHVEDCLYPEKCTSATGDMEVKLQFKNKHHELEVCFSSRACSNVSPCILQCLVKILVMTHKNVSIMDGN